MKPALVFVLFALMGCGESNGALDASLHDASMLDLSSQHDTAILDLSSQHDAATFDATDDALVRIVAHDAAASDAASIDAAPSCAGSTYDGHCWYKGSVGESCTSVCDAHGGYDEATTTYAGASTAGDRTRAAACNAIANLLSTFEFTADVDNISDPNDVGCAEEPNKTRTELVSLGATTAGGQNGLAARFCACLE